jgi:hypothetical protein
MSPDTFRTVMDSCLWALPTVMIAGAAWPIFVPPRRVRSWPLFVRPLLGTASALAAAYALVLGVARPIQDAQFKAHPGFYDYPVLMFGDHPIIMTIGAIAVSYFLFAIRACGVQLLWEIKGRPFK